MARMIDKVNNKQLHLKGYTVQDLMGHNKDFGCCFE